MRRIVLLSFLLATPALADINFSTYYLPNWPPNSSSPGTPISSGTVSGLFYDWGDGPILNSGLSDQVLVHFTGTLTWPGVTGAQKSVTFYAVTDDGFQVNIGGADIINSLGDIHPAWTYKDRKSTRLNSSHT